jgi:DNA end-binding protein Ku
MARAMWRGAIQFGLVTIPVRLYLATESRGGLSFNLLHADDLERIQMKVHCPVHGEIRRSDTVRGYEWSKGRYVVIDQADLEAVPLKTVRSIEIEQFVPARREDPGARFIKGAYYLEPEPVGRRAFALLRKVLGESDLQAICKIVLKDREQLAALDPFGDTMLLSTLYWPDEVRDVADLDLPADDAEFKPAEVAMARQLVEALTGEFEPSRYRDEYREALLRVIDSKVAGEPVEAIAPQPETSRLTDLMAVLEASVAAARGDAAAAATGTTSADASETGEPIPVGRARASGARKRATGGSSTRAAGDGGSSAKSTGSTKTKTAAKSSATTSRARRKTA